MTKFSEFPDSRDLDKLAKHSGAMGFEIADLAGFLHEVEAQANGQRAALDMLDSSAERVSAANAEVRNAAAELGDAAKQTFEDVTTSSTLMRSMSDNNRQVAEWVRQLNQRTSEVNATLDAVKSNNAQIASIAVQVNTLAINAKIEAARAGDAGRGFAIVAEAINSLSQDTKSAAAAISSNIDSLNKWLDSLGSEAGQVSRNAEDVLDRTMETDSALSRMEDSVRQTRARATRIGECAGDVGAALDDFAPNIDSLGTAIKTTTDSLKDANSRIETLVDRSESLVQASASLGGNTGDAPFIAHVQDLANQVTDQLDAALASERITEAQLFDRTYVPINGTNPEQKMAG